MKKEQKVFLATVAVFAILNITLNVRADNQFIKAFAVCGSLILAPQLIRDFLRGRNGIRTLRMLFTILELGGAAAIGIAFGTARHGLIDEAGNLKSDKISIGATAIYLCMILAVTIFFYRSLGRRRLGSRQSK